MTNDLVVVETVGQALVMVDRAYFALTEAVEFQGVRQVRNLAVAAAAFAREAGDTRLLERATELRTRAERAGGQMLADAAKEGQRNTGGKPSPASTVTAGPTLAQIGITRDQSSKWQAVAALSETEFEDALTLTKSVVHEVSAAKVLRAVQQTRQREPEIVEAGDDTVALPPAPRLPTADEQAIAFYNAVRDLSALTLNASELRAALPYYQHRRIIANLARARALLSKVRTIWKMSA